MMSDVQVPVASELTGRRILILFNPTAGSGGRRAKVADLLQALIAAGYQAEICDHPQVLFDRCLLLHEQAELRAVIAAGGDGTASMVMNQLPASIPLATFPLGTENLLAKYLGHSSDSARLARLLTEGQAISLDAGQANGKLFSLMASCGFDAEVVSRLHRDRRGPIRHWSYIVPILKTIAAFRYPLLRVSVDDAPAIECRWAFVVNVPRYAFGLQLDPSSSPWDGLLNVVTLPNGSLLSGLRYLAAGFAGRHLQCAGVERNVGRKVRIESAASANFQIDGDPGGELSAQIECIPNRLRMVVSPQWLQNARA